ncbi:bacillithiol biosynthesis BshC, partial [Bacillus sp. WP8]|uniref:bacillithiol biosynthesis protein BshC n=1 Tax=Bacillus sp. WP8 TaxID=756828 RepID=UPI0037C191BA
MRCGLMEERVVARLGFMGGEGEVKYWGEVKGMFEDFKLKMGGVVARVDVRIVERDMDKKVGVREVC